MFTVTFDEVVDDLSTQLPFTAGVQVLTAHYLTGTGTSQLIYTYTVQPGDLAPDGVVVGPALEGAAQDALGNALDLQLNNVADTSGLRIDGEQGEQRGGLDGRRHAGRSGGARGRVRLARAQAGGPAREAARRDDEGGVDEQHADEAAAAEVHRRRGYHRGAGSELARRSGIARRGRGGVQLVDE